MKQDQQSEEAVPSEKKIEKQSKEQIEQLNKHLGAIEGKVSEITKKYEELKKSDETKDQKIKQLAESRAQLETQKKDLDKKAEEAAKNKKEDDAKSNSLGQNVDKQKIQKFAKMLKQLNQYKSQYKKAQTDEEKNQIHNEVVSYT